MTNEALKSELRESAITMANLPTEFGVACLTEAGAQRIAKVLTDAATALEAMEAMEPVACLVNADAGAMVWPISDIDEAETYCDEGEFPELLYPAPTVSALQARIATQAEHQAKALEGVEPIGYIAWRDGKPAWSEDCVCEDAVFPRDIEDDCTSMAIYPATTVSALQARIAELESELRRVTTSPPTGSAPCARLCEHMAFQIQAKSDARRIAELEQDAVRGEPVGFVMVPSGPTREMLNAAIDVDSFKLGDISPLGFRCSPQQLFERCYRAMLAAAPKETP